MKYVFCCCAVFLLTLFSGCEPFNFTEHFEEQTGRAAAVGWAFPDSNLTEPVTRPDGTVVIAPGDSFIAVTLTNPRNYVLSPDLVNEGPPGSGVCTALQEDSRRVLVAIRGADLYDEYHLTLKLTSSDGSREFEPYPLPVIRCLSFNTDLADLRINGGEAALDPGFDPAITSYRARVFDVESLTLSAAAADPQARLHLDGALLEGGVETTRTLEAGDNPFTLNVGAENGVSEKEYHLTVTLVLSGGANPITIIGGNGGTVSSDYEAAIAETVVTLTVRPDTGYVLKEGSLLVNDGEVALAGSGPEYTFIMPAGEARVTAAFIREAGFGIEGPQDKTVTVTAVHSGGRTPPSDISYSLGESVIFTVDGPYTQEAGNLKWYVNGAAKTGTGNSLTINAIDYIKRGYSLTVLIEDGGLWYSADSSFRVIE
ncbi:MAG: cadherin-like beta sandwich domain-containing protein [Treponema sp.]|nr:cadherin-like beta sandwich domain-containing protein [Treponema sp.]